MKETRTVYDRKFKEEAVRLSYERKFIIYLIRQTKLHLEAKTENTSTKNRKN